MQPPARLPDTLNVDMLSAVSKSCQAWKTRRPETKTLKVHDLCTIWTTSRRASARWNAHFWITESPRRNDSGRGLMAITIKCSHDVTLRDDDEPISIFIRRWVRKVVNANHVVCLRCIRKTETPSRQLFEASALCFITARTFVVRALHSSARLARDSHLRGHRFSAAHHVIVWCSSARLVMGNRELIFIGKYIHRWVAWYTFAPTSSEYHPRAILMSPLEKRTTLDEMNHLGEL